MERPRYYIDPRPQRAAPVESEAVGVLYPTAEYLMGYGPVKKIITLRSRNEIEIEINPRLSAEGNIVEYRPKLAIPGNGTLKAAEAFLGEQAMLREIMRRVTDDSPEASIKAVEERVVDMAIVPSGILHTMDLATANLSRLADHTNEYNTQYSLVARGCIAKK